MNYHQHKFHPTILRAYDIRGIIGTTLSDKDAFAIGLGFAHMIAKRRGLSSPKIAVGYDGRISSPDLAEALADGLAQGGAHVVEIGMGPTPMLYFADRALACDGAIQITGSHNPKDYNGFKMVCAHQSFYGDDIIALGALMAQGITLPNQLPDHQPNQGSRTKISVFDDYIARLAQDAAPLMGHFVWDTGNGAAGPHTLTFLREACDASDALCGLGFDGDGDRLGMIDAKGRQVPGDILTAFLALEFLSRRPGEVILFDVKSSAAAMRLVEQAGGKPQIWKTGHSHMKSRMRQIGCELAGEMSGHIFIKDGYYGFDDALYVAVRVLATMAHTGQTITQFMDNLPPSFTSPECRVDCADDVKFDIMEQLAATAKARYGDRDVLVIDGIRVQDKSGWWLIRASNTEACLVVRAEGIDEAALDEKIGELTQLLASCSISWDYQLA